MTKIIGCNSKVRCQHCFKVIAEVTDGVALVVARNPNPTGFAIAKCDVCGLDFCGEHMHKTRHGYSCPKCYATEISPTDAQAIVTINRMLEDAGSPLRTTDGCVLHADSIVRVFATPQDAIEAILNAQNDWQVPVIK